VPRVKACNCNASVFEDVDAGNKHCRHRVLQAVRALLKFFALTFAVSWVFFIAGAAGAGAFGHPVPVLAELKGALFLIGTVTPALVALWLTARAEGRSGMQALLSRIFKWDVGARWYLFAVIYMPAVKLAVALTHRAITGGWPRLGNEAWYLIVGAMVISTPVQSGEEIGWRGFALHRFADRVGFRRASVLLGVIWATWHLPFFYVPGIDMYGQSFPVFVIGVTAISVALAWLYVRTHGSLLLTMLMHSAINQTVGIVSDVGKAGNPFTVRPPLSFLLTVAFLWIPAVYFLVRMPAAIASEQPMAAEA
jgi:uncharacterized protein